MSQQDDPNVFSSTKVPSLPTLEGWSTLPSSYWPTLRTNENNNETINPLLISPNNSGNFLLSSKTNLWLSFIICFITNFKKQGIVIAWSALPCQGQRSSRPAYPIMLGQLDIHQAKFPHPQITEADTKPLRTVSHHHQVEALVV
jgi:hypothetical protein